MRAGRNFEIRGVVGWLLKRLRRTHGAKPRMALVERIALGPRQSLTLVEADGRRFLVASSAEGGASFLALDARRNGQLERAARVSW